MLYQAILFVVAKSALAHRSHDNPKIELSGSAPKSFTYPRYPPENTRMWMEYLYAVIRADGIISVEFRKSVGLPIEELSFGV
jgi:hypothetical protein